MNRHRSVGMVQLTVAVTAEIINWVRQASLAMFFQLVRFRGVVAIMADELPLSSQLWTGITG